MPFTYVLVLPVNPHVFFSDQVTKNILTPLKRQDISNDIEIYLVLNGFYFATLVCNFKCRRTFYMGQVVHQTKIT
jgi:hypothetical protein